MWRTPFEKLWGYTPDISNIRFKWWDRVWYYQHDQKYPACRILPGQFVGIARNTGDQLTYKILTEPSDARRPEIIVNSVVTPRSLGEKAHGAHKKLPSNFYFPRFSNFKEEMDDKSNDKDLNPRGGKRQKTQNADSDPNLE